jgi:hypothetical protein
MMLQTASSFVLGCKNLPAHHLAGVRKLDALFVASRTLRPWWQTVLSIIALRASISDERGDACESIQRN